MKATISKGRPVERKSRGMPAKKPYITPRLTVHGDAKKLTQALGPGNKDGLFGSILL